MGFAVFHRKVLILHRLKEEASLGVFDCYQSPSNF